ncbi:MAG: cysteine dioxygenase family protein [Candidatus Eremiobacterota bacterium]
MVVEQLLEELDGGLNRACDCQAKVQECCRLLERNARTCCLPQRLVQSSPKGYARHLVYLDPDDRYCVVAMVWGPGQGTAIHDHDGTWCVEGCLDGRLAITSYQFVRAVDENLVELKPERTLEVGVGAVGRLIPPFEHHRIFNPFSEQAVTLHIYGKELKHCTRFLETDQPDTFRKERVQLGYCSRP